MSVQEALTKLQSNPRNNFVQAKNTLIKIVDNVLKNPNDSKVRSLQKSNAAVQKKLLSANGGPECLRLIGFQELDTCYQLPQSVPLEQLKHVKDTLLAIKEENILPSASTDLKTETTTASDEDRNDDLENVKRFVSPPFESHSTRPTVSWIWIAWGIMKLSEILHVAITCHIASREAQMVGSKIHRILIYSFDFDVEERLLIFSQQVTLNQLKFTLCGLFNIDGSLIFNKFSNEFLRRIERIFYESLAFGDKACQRRAKALIPMAELEIRAQTRLRLLQERIKFEKLPDPQYTLQEFLLLELLAWFKEDFFTWVDRPPCDQCYGQTDFLSMSTNEDDLKYTQRVELYRCRTCSAVSKFPRYNDLSLLLETRRGRCGEWAQVFTLLCRSMDWDARYVMDETDHVWTEVFSIGQQRWLHCDPCEAACDTPLIYEHGWGKVQSYVMAYSPLEVQDVTWRYTSNHKAVLARRTQCDEQALVDAIVTLRESRQRHLSRPLKQHLTLRVLRELLELMVERRASEEDMQGRISGSMDWRQTRGEISATQHLWLIEDKNIINCEAVVKYSTAEDCYYFIRGDGIFKIIEDWLQGVYEASGVFRKEETDWKQVYIARNEGTTEGSIKWKFAVHSDSNYVFNVVSIKFHYKTFENGVVDVKLLTDKGSFQLVQQDDDQIFDVSGSKSVEIVAVLSLGKGSVAWQHAQLFRQSLDSKEFPFILSLFFQRKS